MLSANKHTILVPLGNFSLLAYSIATDKTPPEDPPTNIPSSYKILLAIG